MMHEKEEKEEVIDSINLMKTESDHVPMHIWLVRQCYRNYSLLIRAHQGDHRSLRN